MERSDLDRIVRQQVFLSSLTRKMLRAGTFSSPSRLNSLVRSLQQALILDKDWDVLGFAQRMRGISAGDIEFRTAPVQLDQQGQVQLDPARAARFARNLLLPPEQREARERQEKEREQQDRATASVDVYNTTKSSGLAERVRRSLSARGYGSGRVANATHRSTSVVRYAPR